jgi:hypothetical protein
MPEGKIKEYEACLRHAIEDTVGRKMKTPRDFDFLAKSIFEKLHQSLSASTLKRFWGYLPQYSSIRVSTLDLLAQFADYKDWDSFCEEIQTGNGGGKTEESLTSPTSPEKPRSRRTVWYITAAIGVLLVVGTLFMFHSPSTVNGSKPDADPAYMLRRGQVFETYSDYLRLFGITNQDHYWDQPLPHHEGIVVWGPEYHHPQWHNDGDRDLLMPTITEWWEPTDSMTDEKERELLMAERNNHLYFTVMRTNELRITFMKNITDTGFVFLGVYRADQERSDSTHVVWERVAEECDLSNLAYLEQLRH